MSRLSSARATRSSSSALSLLTCSSTRCAASSRFSWTSASISRGIGFGELNSESLRCRLAFRPRTYREWISWISSFAFFSRTRRSLRSASVRSSSSIRACRCSTTPASCRVAKWPGARAAVPAAPSSSGDVDALTPAGLATVCAPASTCPAAAPGSVCPAASRGVASSGAAAGPSSCTGLANRARGSANGLLWLRASTCPTGVRYGSGVWIAPRPGPGGPGPPPAGAAVRCGCRTAPPRPAGARGPGSCPAAAAGRTSWLSLSAKVDTPTVWWWPGVVLEAMASSCCTALRPSRMPCSFASCRWGVALGWERGGVCQAQATRRTRRGLPSPCWR